MAPFSLQQTKGQLDLDLLNANNWLWDVCGRQKPPVPPRIFGFNTDQDSEGGWGGFIFGHYLLQETPYCRLMLLFLPH